MTKGCKIWLWFVFIVNAITLVGLFDDVSALMQAGMAGTGLLILVLSAAIVAGVAILLFSQRKIGFYILVAAVVGTFIMNLTLGVSIAYALVSAIIMPSITYYFISKNSNVFN